MREHGAKITLVTTFARYFEGLSPYYQAVQWNQKTPIPIFSK